MATISKVLVLGASGMLGSAVYSFLKLNPRLQVGATYRILDISLKNELNFELDAAQEINSQMNRIVKVFKPDYIINCIGIINKYCKDDDHEGIKRAIKINSLFPYLLSDYFLKKSAKTKIIQIATDCVFSGKAGNYLENSPHDASDVYGKTKSLGEVRVVNFINIRCSVIGLEKKNKNSLLEWFLSHSEGEQVSGYSHHKWNGVTTLQFAEFCENIIINNQFNGLRSKNHVIHYCPNKTVNKFELLNIFQTVFETNYVIVPVNFTVAPKEMSLKSKYLEIEQKEMIECIKKYNAFYR